VNRSLLRLGILTAAIAVTRGSHADDKAACVAATELGQSLRATHKLVEARAQFLLCARPECPTMVQQACGGWLGEVLKLLPTVVFTAKDNRGTDLVDVTVTVDDHPLVTKLNGEAVAVNPGPHAFRFSLADGTNATKSFVVLEGQTAQRLAVEGLGANAAPSVLAPSPGYEPAIPPHAGHARRVLGIVVGSAGLAGVLVGGVFAGLTFSAWGSSNTECPSHKNCPTSAIDDRSNAVTFGTVSDVGFIAGGVLLAGGTTLYLTAPKDAEPAVTLHVNPGGLDLVGGF
jgi:hypothetical protein